MGMMGMMGMGGFAAQVEFLKLLVHQRRFEELSVHDIMQGLSVKEFQDGMIRRFLTRKGDPFARKAPKLLGGFIQLLIFDSFDPEYVWVFLVVF